jgi:hypothetical protein
MRAFLHEHRHELAPERTAIVSLDELGRGELRFTRREGLLLPLRSHPQLVALCEQIAEDSSESGAETFVNRGFSDGHAASAAGYPAITIVGRPVPDHRQPTDIPERIDPAALERALGFCDELVRRLDAELVAR